MACLQLLHLINQSLGLFVRHTFVAIGRHVWWFLGLLTLEDYFDQLLLSEIRIKLLLGSFSMASNALIFVVRRRIRRLHIVVCAHCDEETSSEQQARCYASFDLL